MSSRSSVQVRTGTPVDSGTFADLVILADHEGPAAMFGKSAHRVMERLYGIPGNLYSYDKTRFLDVDGRTVGLMLGYTDTMYRNDKWRTYRLMTSILKWRAPRMWGMSLFT